MAKDVEETEKKEKKKKKEKAGGPEVENEEEEKLGSKLLLFFVTILIIVIWLAIIGLLIKMDVGGFGSSVLYPIFKDVPVVSWILPEVVEYEDDVNPYAFDSMDAAIVRIKELEAELALAQSTGSNDSDTIRDLQQQVAELSVYKEQQEEFEQIRQKFYDEVVFSDVAPDITEYKMYYEAINPANAEILYKQVVQQAAKNEEISQYAKTYSSMKPKEAAAIFDSMSDDLQLVAEILGEMDIKARGDILGKMDKENAAKVTKIMEPKK